MLKEAHYYVNRNVTLLKVSSCLRCYQKCTCLYMFLKSEQNEFITEHRFNVKDPFKANHTYSREVLQSLAFALILNLQFLVLRNFMYLKITESYFYLLMVMPFSVFFGYTQGQSTFEKMEHTFQLESTFELMDGTCFQGKTHGGVPMVFTPVMNLEKYLHKIKNSTFCSIIPKQRFSITRCASVEKYCPTVPRTVPTNNLPESDVLWSVVGLNREHHVTSCAYFLFSPKNNFKPAMWSAWTLEVIYCCMSLRGLWFPSIQTENSQTTSEQNQVGKDKLPLLTHWHITPLKFNGSDAHAHNTILYIILYMYIIHSPYEKDFFSAKLHRSSLPLITVFLPPGLQNFMNAMVSPIQRTLRSSFRIPIISTCVSMENSWSIKPEPGAEPEMVRRESNAIVYEI